MFLALHSETFIGEARSDFFEFNDEFNDTEFANSMRVKFRSRATSLVVNIKTNQKYFRIKLAETASSRARTLKVSEELIDILKKRKNQKGHVFLTYYGEPFTKNKIPRALTEFKVKGSFKKDWTPMDLRHSFAVNFLKNGGAFKALQYILGHQNVFQTKQLYGEVK